MRKTLISAAVLLAGISLPMAASADPYGRHCYNDDSDQVAGAIVGGLLGGIIGSSVAERGDKTGGTIIGGALGAVAGAAIADGDNCGPRPGYRYDSRYGYNNGYNVGVTTTYGSGYYNNGYYNNGYYGRQAPAPRYNYRHDNRRVAPPRGPRNDYRYDNRRHDNRGHGNQRGAYYGGHQSTSSNVNVSAFVIATGQTRPTTCRSAERRIQNYDGSYRIVRGQECLTVNGGYRAYGF